MRRHLTPGVFGMVVTAGPSVKQRVDALRRGGLLTAAWLDALTGGCRGEGHQVRNDEESRSCLTAIG